MPRVYTFSMSTHQFDEADLFAIERPAPILLAYYFISSFLLGPLFFIPLIPLYFRYHTLRYRFDEEGISMRWGILFRREINLTYARIQDIHLRTNVVERWLGLARIEVQTASGSSGAEMTLEGLLAFDAIRDYLYGRMRGSHARIQPDATASGSRGAEVLNLGAANELTAVLREVTQEIHGLRTDLEKHRGKGLK